ncbi:MAG TPA: DNA polymerase I [Flavobacteriales bacterium]|nr:DNA polymerase I [Flavobacteriales bacterium]|tara:strand:- start:21 stop:2831 length:2811 start_codon:yes stop_codon:yes gene_type:complete
MLSQDKEKKLFLLDAFALIFRAYYAFIKNPRINSKGLNTSAMFGFTNTLLEIINNEKPTHIAVVFDPPGGSKQRKEDFPAYKANREETPNDIILSIPYIKRIIEGFNIPCLVAPGFEADDLIGTLAKQAEKEGYTTYMMTPDKDYAQLVSSNIFMYRPGRFGNPAQVWGIEEIREKFNVEDPIKIIDLLGLMGDKVDNIPGIPGIGPKTASKLLKEFGSVEGIIENADKLKGKQRENVENFAEQGIVSKQLATIILDVPNEVNFDVLNLEELDKDLLREVFTDLEFRTLSKRILNEEIQSVQNEQPSSPQISMFGNAPAMPAAAEVELEDVPVEMKTILTTEHDYRLLDDDVLRAEFIKRLQKEKSFCLDTETTGLDPIEAELVGISIAVKEGEAFYIPVTSENALQRLEELKPILQDPKKEIIAQNFKYDYKVLRKYGVDIKNKVLDTMLVHYLMNPDMKHGMDLLAETYLNYRPVSITELIGKKGKNQKSMKDLEPAEVLDYAAEDADITLQLRNKFSSELEKPHLKDLYEKVEAPLIHVLADIELEGVNIDEAHLRNYSKELEVILVELEKSIKLTAGTEFNLDSPKQLGQILFEVLKISDKPKKTPSGQYKTSEDVLATYKEDHPIISEILDYRQLRKLKSTYVDPLPEMVSKTTGRLHTNYMQTVAATGRLSSNNPNLQNIPIRSEKGREIRKAFIPRDENHTLVAADYSQVELRIIAALSNESAMIEDFVSGADIHAATASKVFGVSMDDVDREMRSKAKAVNFGIIYGQGAFGLAQNLGIKRGEAKEIIENYFQKYSRLKEYMAENVEFARTNGYVETILGRRRYLKDINSGNAIVRGFAERNAVNAPIQGSAADVIKLAMINIHKRFKEENFKSKMIMQVHDELVFDAHNSELEIIKPLIKSEMENAYKMSVPLLVEVDMGANWLEAH